MTKHLPSKLGVGFSYLPAITQELTAVPGLIDFIELSPDILCREVDAGMERRLALEPGLFAEALPILRTRPLVVHGLGLSIGSAMGWNDQYLALLDAVADQVPFHWHSEHLAFLLTEDRNGQPLHAGVPLPLPFTDEALALLVPRVKALNTRYAVPFLLENFTYYLPGLPADHGRDEVAFLNDLVARSGGWLLLDLYNFYCNAKNFGFDPLAALARLRLDRVLEVHVAGGAAHDGFQMDVHSQRVPDAVWQLLDFVAPRAPNLGGIVYEVLEQAVPLVGRAGIEAELWRVRAAWERHTAAFASALAGPTFAPFAVDHGAC
jgi:uncharacterized protein